MRSGSGKTICVSDFNPDSHDISYGGIYQHRCLWPGGGYREQRKYRTYDEPLSDPCNPTAGNGQLVLYFIRVLEAFAQLSPEHGADAFGAGGALPESVCGGGPSPL